jgi:membrane-associated protease RseP (regulator of RpoE activity)
MVATTNCLPAVPLDGGFIFMDWMDTVVSKLRRNATEEERKRLVSTVTTWLALVVLFSVLFMFIGPRIL